MKEIGFDVMPKFGKPKTGRLVEFEDGKFRRE